MPKWTDKPWERQKGESAQAYEAFVTYRDMGSDRSIRAVGQRLDKSRTQIGKWSSAWNWQERVRAYDNELEKEARAKAVKDRKAMTERHIGIAMQLQKKALEALSSLSVEDMSPKDIIYQNGNRPRAAESYTRGGERQGRQRRAYPTRGHDNFSLQKEGGKRR